jgi:purine nucleosidase
LLFVPGFQDEFAILRRVKQPFLFDTDTASGDAVALIMALRSPEVEVLAIATVAGNVGVRQATCNALYTAELCGSKVPVFMGTEKPLRRAHVSADWFHGRDGLGDHGYPVPARTAERKKAVAAIIETIETLILVTLGPLTNIAQAVQRNAEHCREGEPMRGDGGSALL